MLRGRSRVDCRFAMSIVVHFLAQLIWGEGTKASHLCCTWRSYRMKVRQLLKVVTSINRIWNWDLNNFKILDLWSKTNSFSEQNYRYWDNFYVFLIIRNYFIKLRDDFHATKLRIIHNCCFVRMYERRELFKWLQIYRKSDDIGESKKEDYEVRPKVSRLANLNEKCRDE